MSSLSKDGVELTLNIYKPYALFPMSLIISDKRDYYIYDALSKVEGYFAPWEKLENFIKNNPSILFDLLKRIYRGLEGFFQRLESLLIHDAYLRILNQLIIHAKRFGQKEQDKLVFDWHVTHVQLASQTGLARESVTKQIKKLQDKGLISYSGKKLVIEDFLKLEEECFSYSNKTYKN